MELLAITQYMNQHYNLDSMDLGDMAAKVKLIAIDEMRHAEMFAERIKELDGEPTTEQPGKAEKRQQVKDVFPFNAKLEDDTIDAYNQFVLVCRENGDSTSVKIFEAIIDEEQVHFNYFDSVSTHIDQLGDTYLPRIAGYILSHRPRDAGVRGETALCTGSRGRTDGRALIIGQVNVRGECL